MAPSSRTVVIGYPQRSQFTAGDHLGHCEGVTPQQVDVIVNEGPQPRHVLVSYRVALVPQLRERRVHVDRVPQHDDVDHQTESPQQSRHLEGPPAAKTADESDLDVGLAYLHGIAS